MRVIEPRKFERPSEQNRAQRPKAGRNLLIPVALSLLIFIGALYIFFVKKDITSVQTTVIENTIKTEVSVPEVKKSGTREFSGNEFRLLFDNMLLPSTEKVNTPPPVTGDNIADTRIRQIAESRGYKLRRSPTDQLVDIDGYPLQKTVKQPWLDMKNSAKLDGNTMKIVSGYRSVKEQTELFLSKLDLAGVKTAKIISGSADKDIDTILITTAVPGYSKHHTGYVFDLFCVGWAFENFKDSDCHEWLSKNNFENSKKFGFIPSYPAGADLQGPDPEAWEYVYVGPEILNN